jgi:hypothetical protein
MIQLNDSQRADFYHRCYKAVDGLWFMKIEEIYGFETALDIDDTVWKVFPKIQARMIKEMGKKGNGIKALFECFTTKHELEGFTFTAKMDDSGTSFEITVQKCPWHNVMVKSGREHLSGKVGTRICHTECSVWASEFGDDIVGELESQICTGAETCRLRFSQSAR